MEFSAVIITYNEERNIERCLKSLVGLTDDIVVADSFSTDSTVEICKTYGARVFQRAFTGYSDQKNWANTQAKYDYIFSIDADEEISPLLHQSILNLRTPEDETVFSVKRLTNYCGKWIRHGGWYPDTKTRLWNRHNANWTGLIHEIVEFKTPVNYVQLEGDLLHYSYFTIEEHINQSLKFSKLSAIQMFESRKKSGIHILLFAPIFRFLKTYIIKAGFLDGFYGFVIAKISAHATFYKHLWLIEKTKNKF